MTLHKITHIVAKCDCCGGDWWHGITDQTPQFEDQALALKKLATEHGWRIERNLNGRRRMYCRTCAAKSTCERDGCDTHATPQGRLPACIRCGQVRRADQPPAKHPEKITTDMPPWLAALDAEFATEQSPSCRAKATPT